jgi:hypothetical protein
MLLGVKVALKASNLDSRCHLQYSWLQEASALLEAGYRTVRDQTRQRKAFQMSARGSDESVNNTSKISRNIWFDCDKANSMNQKRRRTCFEKCILPVHDVVGRAIPQDVKLFPKDIVTGHFSDMATRTRKGAKYSQRLQTVAFQFPEYL